MTDYTSKTEDLTDGAAGNIRSGLAILTMVVMIALGTAVTAFAGGGGVGTGGGGDGSGDTQSGGDRYAAEWDSFSAKDRRWARQTSECEAGQDPNIHSPGKTYHGAFQFLKSTWQQAPWSKGRDPHRYSWKVQAVVAVKWMHKAGKDQWPVCG
jgi:hypothetical protein